MLNEPDDPPPPACTPDLPPLARGDDPPPAPLACGGCVSVLVPHRMHSRAPRPTPAPCVVQT